MTHKSNSNPGLPAHDRMSLVKEFVEWAKSTPDAYVIQQYWAPKGIVSTLSAQWAHEDPDFRQYYHLGKELIGLNRLKASLNNPEGKSQMDKAVYLRGLRNFDYDQRASEREEILFEAQAKQPKDSAQDSVGDKFDAYDRQIKPSIELQADSGQDSN